MRIVSWLPNGAGAFLGMTYFEGKVLVACENGLYEIRYCYGAGIEYTIQRVL